MTPLVGGSEHSTNYFCQLRGTYHGYHGDILEIYGINWFIYHKFIYDRNPGITRFFPWSFQCKLWTLRFWQHVCIWLLVVSIVMHSVLEVSMQFWLVVWTPLKNISQLGWLFPIYGKIKMMFQTTNQQLLFFCQDQGLRLASIGIPIPWNPHQVPIKCPFNLH